MARREPSIRNWKASPPAGAWNLSYRPPEHPYLTVEAVGHSYTDVLATIHKWRLNNGLPADEATVFQWANAQWCARDPERCTAPPGDQVHQDVAGTARRTLTPADYGSHLWRYLNTLPLCFDQAHWLSAIEHIKAILNPSNPKNHGAGCLTCHVRFSEFNSKYPPHLVTDENQAAVWTWMSHDAANVHSGKPHRPSFQIISTIFGWQPLTEQQIEEIRLTLTTPTP